MLRVASCSSGVPVVREVMTPSISRTVLVRGRFFEQRGLYKDEVVVTWMLHVGRE